MMSGSQSESQDEGSIIKSLLSYATFLPFLSQRKFSGNFLIETCPVLVSPFLSKLTKTTTMINNSIQFRESSIDGR